MSPVAVPLVSETIPTLKAALITEVPSTSTLVIGSPATAQDGSYQDSILKASSSMNVDKQMVDRILDEGELAKFHDRLTKQPSSKRPLYPGLTLTFI